MKTKKTKSSDQITLEVFKDIVNDLAEKCNLTLLDIVETQVCDILSTESQPTGNYSADFFWDGRMVRISIEGAEIRVFDRKIDLAQPDAFEVAQSVIEELQQDPRMLPFFGGNPMISAFSHSRRYWNSLSQKSGKNTRNG